MHEDLKYAFGQEIRRETPLAVFVSLADFKPLIPGSIYSGG